MNYTVSTTKTVDEAVQALQKSVKENKFGVLHIHDVNKTLKEKGVEFANECQILDVCNPHKAKEMLSTDMLMSMVLPCKISVYTDNKQTKISMIEPTKMFSQVNSSMEDVAIEVEESLKNIIDQAK